MDNNTNEPKSNTTMVIAVIAIIIIIGAIVFTMKGDKQTPAPAADTTSVSIDTETDTSMAASALDALGTSELDLDIQ